MAKLTVKELDAVDLNRVGTKIRDDGGLVGVVRASVDGPRIKFDWRYRFEGKVKTVACGTWPKVSLADIRSERNRLRRLLEDGKDPATEKRALRLKAKADQAELLAEQHTRISEAQTQSTRLTVTDLFERWASVDLIRHKDGGAEVRRKFVKDVLPEIGAMAVEDVRKGHVTGVTDALLARGVTRTAKTTFSLMRQMFRFAVDRDIIEFEPTASIRKAKIGGKDVERDRVLAEGEIRQLARQMPAAGLMHSTEVAVWIALSTCCRIGELLQARWKHVDLQAGKWTIPAEASKNGKEHGIYLSDFAMVQFRRLHVLTGADTWCYPNRTGTEPVSSKTVTKQLGDRQRPDQAPMSGRAKAEYSEALVLTGGRWTPHDLRRTGATMMVALGVLPEVAERCLNHVEENRVKRVYQRHSYDAEMREAWRLLGERIELLTRDDAGNVVTLRRTAQSDSVP